MERENYYLLLGLPLDPPELDPNKIGAIIKTRTADWNKKLNSPEGLKYKYYIEQVPNIKKFLLEDDNSSSNRQKEMEAACKAVSKQLSESIAVVSAKGFVTEGDIAKVSNTTINGTKLSALLRPETIRKKITVPVKEAGETFTPPTPPPTDPSIKPTDLLTMKSIKSLLDIVKKKDLYDVLGCPPVGSIQVLQQNAKEVLDAMRKKSKKTAEVSATQELAGYALKLFTDEAGKKGYDLALKNFLAETQLMKVFELRIDDKQKRVTRIDYLKSIEDAQQIGRMSKQEAEYFVYKYFCLTKKAPYPIPPENEVKAAPKISCPVCFTLNDNEAQTCRECGTPLHLKCPKCGKEVTLANTFCQCGFSLGDMPIALTLLKDAKLALASNNIQVAEELFQKALVYWPNHPDAPGIKQDLEKKKKDIAVQEGKEVLKYLTAPQSFSAACTPNNTISLQWKPSAFTKKMPPDVDAKVTYVVIRKKSAVPASPEDGEALVEAAALKYEDTGIQLGQIYGYAVFPCYLGVPKKDGGVFSDKLIVTHDVIKAELHANDSQIQVHWEQPANVKEIICRRKSGSAPANGSDGELVDVKLDANGFIDTELENNVTYHYWIACVFAGPDNKKITTPGITISGTPLPRPPDIKKINYNVTDSGIEFSWNPLKDCNVKLYISPKPFASAGEVYSSDNPVFSGLKQITEADQAKGTAVMHGHFNGKMYLTPVVLKNRIALICKSIPIIQLQAVRNLRARRSAGNLELTWDWPDNCNEVLLLYRSDKTPEDPADANASKVVIQKKNYDRDQAYIIRQCGNQAYYLAIYAMEKESDKTVYSNPQTALSIGNASKASIKYKLIKKKAMVFFGKYSVTLEITVDKKANSIPPLCLVKKLGRQPLRREDGILVLNVPETPGNVYTVMIPEDCIESNAYFKLFLENKEDIPRFSLDHPADSNMRI